MKLSRYLVFNSLATCLALIAQGASAAEAENSSANASENQNDIVVTALKRETRLQDTPASITSLSNESLRQASLESANDLVRAVPSLTITKTLALSGAELLLEPHQLRAAKAELEKSRGAGFRYEPLLGDRKPPLDYTDAPVKTKAAWQ